jgi:hypothetical protein
MTIVNKTRIISKDNEYDREFIDLIKNQGADVYYEMNKDFTGLNRLTFPVNRFYLRTIIETFQFGHVNFNIEEDGTKVLKAYALYVTLVDYLETNIISIGGEEKFLNKILRRAIERARNETEILTVNILPIDRLLKYFDDFGFKIDRTYFIKEDGVVTDQIKAIRLIKEF